MTTSKARSFVLFSENDGTTLELNAFSGEISIEPRLANRIEDEDVILCFNPTRADLRCIRDWAIGRLDDEELDHD